MWYKEILYLHYAEFDFLPLLRILAENNPEATPPLYYLIMKGVISLFGDSPLILRVINTIWTFLLLLVMYLFAKHLFNKQTALAAVCLLLLNPVTIANAQEINLIPFSTLILVSAIFMFYLAITENTLRSWIYYGILIVIALYTHYYAWFIFFSCILFFIFYVCILHRKKLQPPRMWLYFLLVHGTILFLYLPWLGSFLRHFQALPEDIWFEPVNLLTLRNILVYFYTSKFALDLNPFLPAFIPAIFLVLMIFFMLYPQLRHNIDVDKYVYLGLPVVVSTGSVLLFSILFFPVINLRSFYLFFPFFIFLAARAYSLINHLFLKILLVVLLCFNMIPVLYINNALELNGRTRQLIYYMEQQGSPEEPIVASEKISFLTLYHFLHNSREIYFYANADSIPSYRGGGLVPDQVIYYTQWPVYSAQLKAYWLVLVPWDEYILESLIHNDNFIIDPQGEPVEISSANSWLKYKIIHMIRKPGN